MKTACIYHKVDLDGWMSAAITKHYSLEHPIAGEKSIDFIGFTYGEKIPDLSNYNRVVMVDISFPKEAMLKVMGKGTDNVVWLDHHISAIKELGSFLEEKGYPDKDIKGIRDVKFAACELTWKYFFPNEPMPEIVRLLGRYDCFGSRGTDEEKKVLEFQYGARGVMSSVDDCYFFLTKGILDRKDPKIQFIKIDGAAIYNYLCTEATQAYNKGFEIILSEPQGPGTSYTENPTPRKFICINKERFNPINFGIDYHKDGYDGCACFWYQGDTKKWHFSLYNDNGLVDCSVIAKQYGGGGHRGAGGMELSTFKFLDII